MKHGLKMVCFDLNGTLIKDNTWVKLNRAMGITEAEDRVMRDLYFGGIITYEEWADLAFRIYKKRGDLHFEHIASTVFDYTYMDGAREAVAYLQGAGYRLVLISGAMDILVRQVAKEFGIEHYAANSEFIFDEKNRLGELRCRGDDAQNKSKFLLDFCEGFLIRPEECACVGDGDNDLELFRLTGRGITFADSKYREHAWKTIVTLSDLRGLL